MADLNRIAEQLKFLTNEQNDTGDIGTVTSVDKENLTCDVALDSGVTVFDCRLASLADSDYVIFPMKGSQVNICYLDQLPFVAGYSYVEQLQLCTTFDSLKDLTKDLLKALNDFVTATQNIQLSVQVTPSTGTGATTAVITQPDFVQVAQKITLLNNRVEKMFYK